MVPIIMFTASLTRVPAPTAPKKNLPKAATAAAAAASRAVAKAAVASVSVASTKARVSVSVGGEEELRGAARVFY